MGEKVGRLELDRTNIVHVLYIVILITGNTSNEVCIN